MKALVLYGVGDLRVTEVDVPKLEKGTVSVSYTHLTLPTTERV